MYNSNRDILPAVNACLYILFSSLEGRKAVQAICDDFLAVSTLLFEDTGREICLTSHCGSLRTPGINVEGVSASLQFVGILFCLSLVLHRLWFVMYRTLSPVEDLMPTELSCVSLDQSLYDVGAFLSRSSLLPSGVKWDHHASFISWPAWFLWLCNA